MEIRRFRSWKDSGNSFPELMIEELFERTEEIVHSVSTPSCPKQPLKHFGRDESPIVDRQGEKKCFFCSPLISRE